MGAGFGQEAEDGDQARGGSLVSLGLARGRVEMANESEWPGLDGDAGRCLTPPAREGPSGRITAVGPFPSAAPGPASMFAGPGPRAGGSYWTAVLGRRARPPLVEFPTGLAPPADRMRLAFPLGVPGGGRCATRPRGSEPPGPGAS